MILRIGTLTLALCALSLACITSTFARPPKGFWAQRSSHDTALIRKGPSPQPFEKMASQGDISIFSYESEGRKLKGFFRLPKLQRRGNKDGVPVLLYLHGGWALGAQDVLDCQQFTDAGFAVVAPAYRGENGNPGHHEMWYGELDDALAALRWIRKQPNLDGERVVVFGHSAGGALSGLMTLVPGVKVKALGSAGGFYSEEAFEAWGAPFELTPLEVQLRVPYRWVSEFRYPHLACVGTGDLYPATVTRSIRGKSKYLHARFVEGDHFTSLQTCFTEFLAFSKRRLK